MSDVTGMDFRVLQCLIGQSNVAKFIQDVVLKIEAFELARVTFTCDGGTHRSVGVCNLLILLVYPNATFRPHTKRTHETAGRLFKQYA